MSRIAGWTALVGLGLTPFLWGNGSSDDKARPPSVERLIEQLGDPDFTVRDRASQNLAALGPKALPALQKAKEHSDLEVRRRVNELIPVLERYELFQPKRVTLRLDKRPVRDAVTEIAKQTGYKITVWPDAQSNGEREKVLSSFDLDKVPFWKAIDQVCAVGGLALVDNYAEGLSLHFQETVVPFVHFNGPFRIQAQGFQYSRSINFATLPKNGQTGGQTSENLNFSVGVYVEPKLPLLGVGQPELTVAQDERSNSMLPIESPANRRSRNVSYYYGYRSHSQTATANLLRPSREAQTAKLIRGTIPVTLLVEQKPDIVVEKILTIKNQKYKTGSIELDVESVTKQGNTYYLVKVAVRKLDPKQTNDYNWSNTLNQRIELQDAKGNKYQSQGYDSATYSSNSFKGTFRYVDPSNGPIGPPAKLVYYTWVTMLHQVAFEFKDLPLP